MLYSSDFFDKNWGFAPVCKEKNWDSYCAKNVICVPIPPYLVWVWLVAPSDFSWPHTHQFCPLILCDYYDVYVDFDGDVCGAFATFLDSHDDYSRLPTCVTLTFDWNCANHCSWNCA